MQFAFAFILFFLSCIWSSAQISPSSNNFISKDLHDIPKPILDSTVLGKWPSVSGGSITNDGKYVSYIIERFVPVKETITVLQSADGKWKQELKGVDNIRFTSDSKHVVFIKPEDGLSIWTLGSSNKTVIHNVSTFLLVPQNLDEWLVYQLATDKKELVVRSMLKGKEHKYISVINYAFSSNGKDMVLNSKSIDNKRNYLEWISLEDEKRITIWTSEDEKIGQIVFDDNGKQLAFRVDINGKRSLWYYHKGEKCAKELGNNESPDIDKSMSISRIERFSKDGSLLFFNLERNVMARKVNPQAAKVTVWSYNDPKLQCEQLWDIKENRIKTTCISVLNIKSGHIIKLQDDHERIVPNIRNSNSNDNVCLALHLDAELGAEQTWNPFYQRSTLFLISLRDGRRLKLPWQDNTLSSTVSPTGKYIIYRGSSTQQYFSYEVATGNTYNITQTLGADLTRNDGYRNRNFSSLIPLAGWLKEDVGVLIYDRHDIWLVDPLSKQKPINLTNGYGLRNGIILRLAMDENRNKPHFLGEKIILTAFNERTKENGYFSIVLGQKCEPTLLIMDNCLYSNLPALSNFDGNLIKASNANAWLLTRQTVSESPNYFWTSDLKTMHRISDIRPEKDWNWLTAELHNWVAPDGDSLQGVLYKPQNFDSSQKYPVLVYYYRQLSNELNVYQSPNWSTSRINIPWFVSRGYLVFTPDIHHSVPDLQASVVNCVVSAGEYLAKLPFVDAKRIGIQGHSFGGLETAYLITNTTIFAAACAASGYYNLVSDVGAILPHGLHRGTSESHMGGSLWQRTNDFINNSPIFYLDKISTPILIMTGDQDGQVPHDQSIELFVGLRRLGKKAWMLSYEGEGHILENDKAINDYTIRMTQFYDYYLKGFPPPLWMTEGIPAIQKEIKTGFELDYSGKVP